MSRPDRCAVPKCRGKPIVIYLDRGLCHYCWAGLSGENKEIQAKVMKMIDLEIAKNGGVVDKL